MISPRAVDNKTGDLKRERVSKLVFYAQWEREKEWEREEEEEEKEEI